MDKTAREMFEELGYHLDPNPYPSGWMIYLSLNDGSDWISSISFILDDKSYSCVCHDGYETSSLFIDIPLHKAITQQMKELGWLDE